MTDQFDQQFWDERYSSQGQLWSGNPNQQLVSQVEGLSPGRALDVGCGEGADAIWLAEGGWQVTAVDISAVALQRAAARAAEAGTEVVQRIHWLHEDLLAWSPEPAAYDLVSAHYMQLPQPLREALFRRLAASVAPGGSLLIVGHHPWDMHSAMPRPKMPELLFTAAEVATLLDGQQWEIIINAAAERSATDPDGHAVAHRDAVLRARRR